MATHPEPLRLESIPHLCARYKISKSSYYDRINPRSPRYDPKMPKPIKIGRTRRIISSEGDAYILDKVQESLTARTSD